MRIERVVENGRHYIVVWMDDDLDGDFYVSSMTMVENCAFTFRKILTHEHQDIFQSVFASAQFEQMNPSQRVTLSKADMALLVMVATVY